MIISYNPRKEEITINKETINISDFRHISKLKVYGCVGRTFFPTHIIQFVYYKNEISIISYNLRESYYLLNDKNIDARTIYLNTGSSVREKIVNITYRDSKEELIYEGFKDGETLFFNPENL